MQAVDDHDPVVIDVERSAGPLLPLELDVDRVILDVTQPATNIRESKIIYPKALASQVSDTATAATPTTLKTTNYLADEEDTSTEEGLSGDDDKSSNKVLAINNNDPEMIDVRRTGPLLPPDLDVHPVILNGTQQTIHTEESIITDPQTLASEVSGTTTSAPTHETMRPMTLVDHESWENMVQAASLMAVVLNQSVTPSVHEEKQGLNVTPSNLKTPNSHLRLFTSSSVKSRRKRFVHAIPIDLAKPHHLPVKAEVSSPTEHSDKIADAQEFQRLIELQDDEIHDRVALRYLRQYVGPALFNICAFDTVEPAAKYTILFNSSRLVLAITNFTLDGMSVVMTPARTLLRADSRCAPEHLECQLDGMSVVMTPARTLLRADSRCAAEHLECQLDGMSVVMTPARTLLRADSRCAAEHLECQLDGMSVVMTPARTLLRADSRCAAEHLECQLDGMSVVMTPARTLLRADSRCAAEHLECQLDGMSVVMTPARTLLRADSRCAPEHLECQVLGARVCIDSLNACDGVANLYYMTCSWTACRW
ncbi:hypothetical protein PYW07_014614 [Mythimna separata]|uniref:Uncharacterized protein n=1 Tax=Mythimna separata TaxID=271217 RepID=A0AAD8DZP1_MYTSE|nr:hypothetical protein PYW07_014614 [Mythimna separata]